MAKPVRTRTLKLTLSTEEMAEIEYRWLASGFATRAAYARQSLLTGDPEGRDRLAEQLGEIGRQLSRICHSEMASLTQRSRRQFVDRIEEAVMDLIDREGPP